MHIYRTESDQKMFWIPQINFLKWWQFRLLSFLFLLFWFSKFLLPIQSTPIISEIKKKKSLIMSMSS